MLGSSLNYTTKSFNITSINHYDQVSNEYRLFMRREAQVIERISAAIVRRNRPCSPVAIQIFVRERGGKAGRNSTYDAGFFKPVILFTPSAAKKRTGY